MSNIKRLKLKIVSIIMLVVMLSLECSPLAVKATAQQLQFYSAGSVSVGYDSYNGKNVFYGYSTLGGNIAYCVDYTCPLPSGKMSFSRYLSDQGLAVLIHGYPNISAAALGVNNNEEAYMATQMAFWEVLNRTGESRKSGRVFRVENVTPKSGMEGFYKRTTAAAAKLVAMAESSPITDVPTLTINTQSVQRRDLGSDSLVGPYYLKVTGLSVSNLKSIGVSLDGAPASARLTDENGNTKTSFGNGDAVYVRLNSNENTTSFKVKFNADVDRKVGLIYTTGGNVQDYAIIDTIPNSMSDEVTINWKKVNVNGEIELVKVDQDNQPVSGAEFNLLNSKGEVLANRKTGSDGKINFYNVPEGNYTLEEVSAPQGYVIKNKTTNVTVKSNQKTPVKIVNERITGKIIITKVDDTNKPLKNVVFEIYNEKGYPITKVTTDDNGKASATVDYGKYYFKEISAPAGYIIKDTVYEFSVTNENRTFYKTVTNETYKGTLIIVKTDDKNTPIQGVKFNILDSNNNVILTITTNANGVAGANNIPYGTYYYQEVEAPSNVVMDKNKYEFKITENNQVIKKEIINKLITGKIEITKVDNTSKKIANVKFNILDENGKIVDTIVTNSEGVATSKELTVGKYFYQEVEVPNGYIMDTDKHGFEISNSTTIKKTVVNDIATGKLKVVKFNNEGKYIQNVKFNILDEKGNVVDTIVTNSNGVAVTKSLPLGTYYYQEIEAPDNVVMDTTKHIFVLSENNQIITKNIINKYQHGKLKVIKVDENNKPLAGVKFNILDENKKIIDTIITDKNGVAESKDLEKGSYYFQEIEAPEGIIVDNTMYDFKVEYDGQVVIKNIINNYAKGTLVITKYNSLGKVLEGVKFQILDEAKQVVDTIVTDENGVATSKKLLLGTYYYQEIEAPDNVVIDTQIHEFVLSQNNQVIKKNVINELIQGSLKIIKVDENNKPLAGVKFNILDENKNVVDVITTDKAGIAVSKELEKGKYYYQEIEAPEGIIIDSTLYDFIVEENGQNVVKNMINYYAKGKIVIDKYDSNNNKLSNVKFNILDEDGKVVDTIMTDENGVAESKELVLGTYYYQEVEAPSNVVIDTNKYEFTLNENNQVITKKVINKLIQGKIKIFKMDREEKPLANVKFNILDENKKVIDTIITDENGNAQTKELKDGTYYFQEIEAPEKYIVDDTIVEMQIENGVDAEARVINYYKEGKLRIIKVDENNEPLAGVKFNILDENKNIIDTIVTNENGIAESKKLVLGTYYYQEIEAPEGIVIDNNEYKFTIEYDGQNVIANMVNYYAKGTLRITKYDSKNRTLENVVFNILDKNGNVVDTIKTDKNGIAESKKLMKGTYYYQEIEAPSNVVIDDNKYEFIINENNQVISKTVINKTVEGKLHIIKVDENSKPLAGIKFNIIDLEGKVVDTIVTDENGVAESKDLEKGTYYYQEVEAPENIVIDNNKYEFTIEYDGQNVIANMVNYYVKGKLEITKLDEDTNERLQGVKFAILDEDRNEVEVIVTDENGIATSSSLLYGTYYFKEIEAPSGYIKDNNEYSFTIDSNEVLYQSVIYNKKQRLPQTGGALSSNAQIVLLVSIISIFGYAISLILNKREEY